MSKGDDKIKDIFQDAFENFEAPVKPSAWSGIESGMNAGASGGAAGGSSFGEWVSANVGWVTSGIVAVSAAAIIAVTSFGDQPEDNITQQSSQKVEQSDKAEETKIAEEALEEDNIEENGITQESEITENTAPSMEQKSNAKEDVRETESTESPTNVNTGSDSKSQNPAGSNVTAESNSAQDASGSVASESANDENDNSISAPAETEINDNTQESPKALTGLFEVFISEEEPLNIRLMASDSNADEFRWNFGDGKSTVTETPFVDHEFSKPGKYTVKLTSVDGESSINKSKEIELFGKPELVLPNVFSPNGDRLNDFYTIDEYESKNIESYTLRVFTLDGEQIFQSHAEQQDWNGEMPNGAPAPEGKYVVVVKAFATSGKQLDIEQKVITLTR